MLPFETRENTTSLQSIIDENTENIKKILMRIDSLVIGPGAGRDPVMIGTLSNIIPYVIQRDIPLVLDGDGLWVVTENPSLLKGYIFIEIYIIDQRK